MSVPQTSRYTGDGIEIKESQLKRLLILPVVLGLIVIGALLIFNSGFFHPQMEARLRQATGADVRLGRMQVALKWPLTLNVLASQISHPAYVVQWSSL
ncbi:MAG: hypothetical protein AB7P49_15140 [Bdellovibrionales bacterium]